MEKMRRGIRVAAIGGPVAPAPGRQPPAPAIPVPSAPARLELRAYPPESDNVHGGLRLVLDGAYDVPGLAFDMPPTIVDIGAHVGSASVFFARRFPGARIYAYEPSPDSLVYCRQNVAGIAELIERAVVAPGMPATMTLYEGQTSTGQRSLYQLGEQRPEGVEVPTMPATELPPCDILKADCEGSELAILRSYPHLAGVRVLMLEWHRDEDYKELLDWLPTLGFQLVRDDAKGGWLAHDRNLIFVRRQETSSMFQCPRSSLAMILNLRREYDLSSLPRVPHPRILDVGSHVGGFAWYAIQEWPDATVMSYEPHPETFKLLAANVAGLRVTPHNVAVVHPRRAAKTRLFEGVNGRHECSLRDDVVWGPDDTNGQPHVSQQLDNWIEVDTLDASELPPCDVMKCDTEGSEVEIIAGYRHLAQVRALLVETHPIGGDGAGQVDKITRLAAAAGLHPIAGGLLRFAR